MKFGTKLIHNGNEIDKETGALSIPIYQVSTFNQEDFDIPPKYEYSRCGNPTRHALEDTIAQLEGGTHGFAFASGIAAIATVLSIFKTGDHIIMSQDVYGGTYRLSKEFFAKYNIEFTAVEATDLIQIENAIKPNTKAIYLETPSNPLLKITDLKGAADIAKKYKLISIIDNTFMTPYLQRPLALGIDIVVHSATKFIGGHSDVIAGLAVVKDQELAKRIYFVQNGFGAVLGPQDSWLLLRGLKTLKIRMDFQQKVTLELAEWLYQHENVANVYYPGLKNHQGYNIHASQSDGPGAVLSFETKDVQSAKEFMRRIKLAALAVSLGGVETIISYPVKTSHASVPKKERDKLGISDKLLRVSLGLEDIEDLFEDFDQALK